MESIANTSPWFFVKWEGVGGVQKQKQNEWSKKRSNLAQNIKREKKKEQVESKYLEKYRHKKE